MGRGRLTPVPNLARRLCVQQQQRLLAWPTRWSTWGSCFLRGGWSLPDLRAQGLIYIFLQPGASLTFLLRPASPSGHPLSTIRPFSIFLRGSLLALPSGLGMSVPQRVS